jgi:serine/threonine-protein kinase RsbW
MSPQARFEGAARMPSLVEATLFIEAFCARHAIDRRDALRLSLIVEELWTNTVVHGHGGGSDAPVKLSLRVDPARVSLDYADTAPPYDPLAWLSQGQAALAADLADRPVGQLGITLVAELATQLSYAHRDGWNCLHLELDRQP